MKFLFLLCFPFFANAAFEKGVTKQVQYLYDFTLSGGASTTISLLPLGSSLPVSGVVQNMHIQVLEPLTSSGGASFTVGYTGNLDAWIPSTAYTTAVNNYTKNAGQLLSESLWDNSNDVNIPFLIDSSTKAEVIMNVGNADLTGGKYILWFDVFVPSRN